MKALISSLFALAPGVLPTSFSSQEEVEEVPSAPLSQLLIPTDVRLHPLAPPPAGQEEQEEVPANQEEISAGLKEQEEVPADQEEEMQQAPQEKVMSAEQEEEQTSDEQQEEEKQVSAPQEEEVSAPQVLYQPHECTKVTAS